MEQEQKELVWLPKSLAIKVKDLAEGEVQSKLIIDYINECKKELQINIESMDEDVLVFRGLMASAKKSFKEVKETELSSFYELWEKFENDKKQIGDFVKSAKKELEPLKKELNALKELMYSIDKWGIQDLLNLIDTLNKSFYGETKEMVQFLFNNYKKIDIKNN